MKALLKFKHPHSWIVVLALLFCGALTVAHGGPGDKTQGALKLEEIARFLASDGVHEPYYPVPPRGFNLDQVTRNIPDDNPMTRAKVELGRQLYFDKRLSYNNRVSCATCHHPNFGYGDARPTSVGVDGSIGNRNAPTVINRLFSGIQFWDGRAGSLEEQALGPIENPKEMGNTLLKACQTIENIPGYRLQFLAVFGSAKVTPKLLGKAIAAFERSVLSGDSVWDLNEDAKRYAAVDLEDEDEEPALKAKARAVLAEAARRPMSEAAKRGEKLFLGKANCSLCHTGANFTDELYHNIGVGFKKKHKRWKPDLGRFVVTGKEKDKGAFKTPTLRNIVDTGPYMHDGSEKTLEDVIEYYDRGGEPNQWLSDRMKPLKLTEQEKKDLVEFLKSLSGHVTPITVPRLP